MRDRLFQWPYPGASTSILYRTNAKQCCKQVGVCRFLTHSRSRLSLLRDLLFQWEHPGAEQGKAEPFESFVVSEETAWSMLFCPLLH